MQYQANNPQNKAMLRSSTLDVKLPNKFIAYLNDYYCGLLLEKGRVELLRIDRTGKEKIFDKTYEKYLPMLRKVAHYAKWDAYSELI